MSVRTMEVSLNEVIFQRLEQAARLGGLSVSEFVLQLFTRWFGEVTVAELERQEIEAYKRLPVAVGEFDGMPHECAVNFHHIQTVPRQKLGRLLATLSEEKMRMVGPALCFALGVDLDTLLGDYIAGR